MDGPASYIISKDKHAFKRIPVGQIVKNPNQPRRIFDAQGLFELEQSIRQYGLITPLTVRKKDGCYELIAGERRLRAAKAAGLETVPCYIMQATEEDSGLMALVENLQRRDLDFFEEALSLQRLTRIYGLTQSQAAERIGKTQSSVANKLRLLKLDARTIDIVRAKNLTERHARALLRIEEGEAQAEAARHIADRGMNVEATEGYIDSLLIKPKEKPQQNRRILIKDVRIFINTIDRAMQAMQKAGIEAQAQRQQIGDDIVMTLRIPAAHELKQAEAHAVSRETITL